MPLLVARSGCFDGYSTMDFLSSRSARIDSYHITTVLERFKYWTEVAYF